MAAIKAGNGHYQHHLDLFLEQMKVDGYSASSLESYKRGAEVFFFFFTERKIRNITEVTKGLLKEYRSHLYYYKQKNGKSLAVSTQADRIIALRLFFKIMKKRGELLYDFGQGIEIPRRGSRVPRNILTVEEVRTLLSLPDTGKVLGYRNRVILEVLYATGIRNGELRNLTIQDVDTESGSLTILNGKGSVDRVVPIDDNIIFLITEYMQKVRLLLVREERINPCLFLGRYGCQLNKDSIWFIVKKYAEASGIQKKISCHVFRHSIASHLLERGMDIRYIQELLGHKNLNTTQIYTRVTINDLRRMYRRFHPKEVRKRDRARKKV